MEQRTYEIIIEVLTAELEMERWKRKQAEKRAEELTTKSEEAEKIIDDLRKMEA